MPVGSTPTREELSLAEMHREVMKNAREALAVSIEMLMEAENLKGDAVRNLPNRRAAVEATRAKHG